MFKCECCIKLWEENYKFILKIYKTVEHYKIKIQIYNVYPSINYVTFKEKQIAIRGE